MKLRAFVMLVWFAVFDAQAGDVAYLEEDGLLVIEMESAAPLPGDWAQGPNGFDADQSNTVNDPESATGNGFIVWEGPDLFNAPGSGLIVFQIEIQNPGVYRFKWRNQVGRGTNTTEHNDSWLKIEADAFYGERRNDGSVVCPKGHDPARNDCPEGWRRPEGSGKDGWFKIYAGGANDWSFSTNTSDSDAHRIFARFDTPGPYTILISGRSSSHVIDRLVMYSALFDDDGNLFDNDGQNLDLPESAAFQPDLLFGDGFETTF